MMPSLQAEAAQQLCGSTAAKLADYYTDALGFGWLRRPDKLANPLLDFSELLRQDDRLVAALAALHYLGEPAQAHMQALLKEPLRRGGMFALAAYALTVNDTSLFDAAVAVSTAFPELQAPLCDAICWAPATPQLEAAINRLAPPWRLRAIALRHNELPGAVERTLAWLRTHPAAPADIAAILDLLRQLGDPNLAQASRRYLDHDTAAVRLAAAHTLLVLVPEARAMALATLLELATDDQAAIQEAALRCLVLHAPASAQSLLDELAQQPDHARLYLQALGWAGDPAAIPNLIVRLNDRPLARVAGAALALITGGDPARDGWLGSAPARTKPRDAGDASLPFNAADDDLPWPDADAFTRWWHQHQAAFPPGLRYFAGRPLALPWLHAVLVSGPLPWRPIAAEHLQGQTGGPLFATSLPAHLQRARFNMLPEKPAP